jgi:hypothetical protein
MELTSKKLSSKPTNKFDQTKKYLTRTDFNRQVLPTLRHSGWGDMHTKEYALKNLIDREFVAGKLGRNENGISLERWNQIYESLQRNPFDCLNPRDVQDLDRAIRRRLE